MYQKSFHLSFSNTTRLETHFFLLFIACTLFCFDHVTLAQVNSRVVNNQITISDLKLYKLYPPCEARVLLLIRVTCTIYIYM